jgi:hypothetical protein
MWALVPQDTGKEKLMERIGLTFDEYVELKLRPHEAADRAFHEAAEMEREQMFPMTLPAASSHLRSRGYDCRPAMLELLVKDGVVTPAGPDAWMQADVDAAAEHFEQCQIFTPYAAREARTEDPSIHHKSQSIRPSRSSRICNASRMRSNTPSFRQRRKWWYTVCHGPKRSGRSRHGAPVRNTHINPFSITRTSRAGRPVRAVRRDKSGSTNAHCSSVSSCRFMPADLLSSRR